MKKSAIRSAMVAVIIVPAALVSVAPSASAADASVSTALQQMAVEEKLAHDVYTVLGDEYSVRQFDQIAASEARHLAAVRTLMTRYGVVDPTVRDAVGDFDSASAQALFDELVADGSASLSAAANSGIAIEKLDIADLRAWLSKNLPGDVDVVLSSLLQGSQNHLRAFTRLEARG